MGPGQSQPHNAPTPHPPNTRSPQASPAKEALPSSTEPPAAAMACQPCRPLPGRPHTHTWRQEHGPVRPALHAPLNLPLEVALDSAAVTCGRRPSRCGGAVRLGSPLHHAQRSATGRGRNAAESGCGPRSMAEWRSVGRVPMHPAALPTPSSRDLYRSPPTPSSRDLYRSPPTPSPTAPP
jgi:hypothetical protein